MRISETGRFAPEKLRVGTGATWDLLEKIIEKRVGNFFIYFFLFFFRVRIFIAVCSLFFVHIPGVTFQK